MAQPPDSNPAPELWLRFVSPTERRAVVGMEMMQKVLEVKGFRVDHADFQVINKREVKRPINPKFKEGPKETVILEERVNINTAFKHLRQLGAKARQNSENVLLVQIERIKGEAIAYPLIFPALFDQGTDIIITGITKTVLSQLTAKPDPTLAKMPEAISQDEVALADLLGRAKRKKGMQSTARELLNIQGLKPEVVEKVTAVAHSKPNAVTDDEVVNLILLADIASRYQPVLDQFWNDVTRKASPVAVLGKQFAQLMAGLPLPGVLNKLKPFLDHEKTYKSFDGLFAGIYQCLQGMENKHFEGDPRLFNPQTLAATIKGVVVIGRSQLDPGLWKKCVCFYSPDDERSDNNESVVALAKIADSIISRAAKEAAHSTQSFQDIYDITNTCRYIQNTAVSFDGLEPNDLGLFSQNLAKRWGYMVNVPMDTIHLFGELQHPMPQFYRSLKSIGSVYGYALSCRLSSAAEAFFKPGLKSLKEQYGEEFFEICYYQCVTSLALPVSRAQLAQWLKTQSLVKSLDGLGYPEDTDTEPLDPWITDAILSGSQESIIPETCGPEELTQAFREAQKKVLSFFKKLEKHPFESGPELNPATQLLQVFKSGVFDIDSKEFREAVKGTYLGEEFEEVIQNATSELKTELQNHAKGSKLILMIPSALRGLFFLSHRFKIRGAESILQVHLLVSSSKKTAQLTGIHKQFSSKIGRYLQDTQDPYRLGLIQTTQMLNEYQKTTQEYLRFLGLLFFDRFLEGFHQKEECNPTNGPEQIKKKVADRTKMVIGQVKGIRVNKLLNFADPKLQREAMPMENQSLAQFRQAVFYTHNVTSGLEKIINKTNKLLNLLGRFSASMKNTPEYKQLGKLYGTYLSLITLPIDKWTDRMITELGEVTLSIKKSIDESEGMDAPGDRLRKEWNDRNPGDENILKPHKLFSHERVKTDNFLFELTQARDLLNIVSSKKCIIFAPEKAKKGQIKQIVEILGFLQSQYPKVQIYLEDASVSDEDRELLARSINPKNFFDSSKL